MTTAALTAAAFVDQCAYSIIWLKASSTVNSTPASCCSFEPTMNGPPASEPLATPTLPPFSMTTTLLPARTASTAADATDRQRALLAEFSARPAVSRAVVCDRIAEAVPAQVVLTRLAVEPLTKRFEAGKPLQRQERTAVVAGTAPAAGDVSTFVERLAGAACCRTVRLTNVERERDAERLVFRIEIGL